MSARWPPDGVPRAVRDVAKGTGWSAWSGTLTRIDGDIAFHAYDFAAEARFLAVPVAWNKCLWRLLLPDAPPRRSPSFHFRGVHAPVPIIDRHPLAASDAAGVAAGLLGFAEAAVRRAARARLDDFPTLMALDAECSGRDDFAISEALWHLVEGRPEAARAIARAVERGARRPSFHLGAVRDGRSVSFFEAVLTDTDPGPAGG